MMQSAEQLVQSLSAVKPLELQAVSLLRDLRSQTGEWFPTTLDTETQSQVMAATTELIRYTQSCQDALRRLSHVQPIPLMDIRLDTFPL
jgi:hypothetical protein